LDSQQGVQNEADPSAEDEAVSESARERHANGSCDPCPLAIGLKKMIGNDLKPKSSKNIWLVKFP
jgi:hypothetical protein